MKVIADLQIHSKYSRAVSQEMVIPKIWDWGRRKGIDLIATGDWMHPLWMREIKANLEEMGNGLLKLKSQNSPPKAPACRRGRDQPRAENLKTKSDLVKTTSQKLNLSDSEEPYFLLATEISSIYSQGGKARRIHNLIWSPSIETADKINKELIGRGANLISDGRPIVGLTSMEIAELVFSIDPTCLLIPAHAWTPWFSLYGSESGFDSIDECFGQFAKYIYAIETGLSSDPSMNWRIKELDSRSIISCSDAHSGPKLGREATVFQVKNAKCKYQNAKLQSKNQKESDSVKDTSGVASKDSPEVEGTGYEISYKDITDAIKQDPNANWEIGFTIEFYPEEGKYHYTGHRNCGIKQDPTETKQKGTICPVCGRKLTIGVMHRVEQLAGRSEQELRIKNQELGRIKVKAIYSEAFSDRPPFVKMVPLQEILAEAFGSTTIGKRVQNEYQKLTDILGGEFTILLETDIKEIAKISGPKVSEAIEKVRNGDIVVDPGYDGVFGVVKIWDEKNPATGGQNQQEEKKEQMSLF